MRTNGRRIEGLGEIGAFLEVADTLSFVEAGRRLGLSASAIGKSIGRLEERFGTRLFHRTTRRVALTEDGARFLARSERIVDELRAAEEELARASTAPTGRLRVALPMANAFFPGLLAEFSRAYPAIELDVEMGDRLVDLVHEGFDIAIRTGEPDDSRLGSRKLSSFRHVIVGAPGYLADHPAPSAPVDLSRHRLLLYRKPRTGKIEPWPAGRGTPSASVVTNSVDALVILALAGRGLASVPAFFVDRELRDGRLVRVLAGQASEATSLRLVWPTRARLAPKVRAFIDFFAARLPRSHCLE